MSLDMNFITVQFRTTTDDKDDDTLVACTVNRITNGIKGPNLAAAEGTWGGHLNDNSWSPAINLGYTSGPWISGQEYALTVTIDPNGHDTWRFDCQLAIKFQGREWPDLQLHRPRAQPERPHQHLSLHPLGLG